MDLNTVTELHRPTDRAGLDARLGHPTTAPLAGGTWLFSQPQPDLRALVDLTGLAWTPLAEVEGALEIAATCTLAELAAHPAPARWPAWSLVRPCCEALAGSFKIWHTATVGGNICLGLAAGPMTSLAVALDGTARVWTPGGGERHLPVAELVLGDRRTALAPGEVLRAVRLPASALAGRAAFRRAALAVEGRSGSVVTGRRDPDDGFVLTVTAATDRPYRFGFAGVPCRDELGAALAGIPRWFDDPHGSPDWRCAVTGLLAEEIRTELS